MKNVFYFLITISLIINIKTTSLNDNKTSCYKLQGEVASKENCNGIYVGYNEQYDSCCFITYKDKETEEEFSRCGYLENTEYGIKVYKHIWAQYKQIKVLCESYYNGRFISISLLIIFLFI